MSASSSLNAAAMAFAICSLAIVGAGRADAGPARVLQTSPSILDKVGLNPQPLPPKEGSSSFSGLDKVSLNPQPLPPKQGRSNFSGLDKVSLNPQPLPPNDGGSHSLNALRGIAVGGGQ